MQHGHAAHRAQRATRPRDEPLHARPWRRVPPRRLPRRLDLTRLGRIGRSKPVTGAALSAWRAAWGRAAGAERLTFGPRSRLLTQWRTTTETWISLLRWAQSARRRPRSSSSTSRTRTATDGRSRRRVGFESAGDPDQDRRRLYHDPASHGGWETASGELRREKTVIVYTYVKPDRFLAQIAALREFLHRFAREANQEVVVAELSGAEGSWFFRIKEYDE